MNKINLLSLCMEMEFGSRGCRLLKSFVNEVLDSGEWHDGFDIAVKTGDLDYYECTKLFDIVKTVYPNDIIDSEKLKSLIEHYLPQAGLTDIVWLVAEDGSLIITDSLRVARFFCDRVIWVTKRISWDGIKLNRINAGVIEGEWYSPINSQREWSPLKLSFDTGALLEGKEIQF